MNSARRLAILAVCSSVWTVPAVAQMPPHAGRVAPDERFDETVVRAAVGGELDTLLSRYAEYGFAGTVLVARCGEVVLLKGYGLADRGTGTPNAPTTLFDVGSVTKTLTGAAALALAEDGLLAPSDRVSLFLGDLGAAKNTATIHHLATHKAGLVVAGAEVTRPDRRDFVRAVKEAPAESAPGSRYRYTNAGTSLLAAVVEELSGVPYEEFARERLLRPAGISSGFRWEPEWNARRARGYSGGPAELVEEATRPGELDWGVRGAGGWIASVPDLYRWVLALTGGRVLGQRELDRMFDASETEAYGWHWEPASGKRRAAFRKGGDVTSFQTQILFYPLDDVVIVWTNNDTRHRWRTLLNDGLERVAVERREPWLPPPVRPAARNEPRRVVGTYADAAGRRLEVREHDGHLTVVATDSKDGPPFPEVAYFPTVPGVFTALAARALSAITLRFDGAVGAATRLTWSDGAAELSARRVDSSEP